MRRLGELEWFEVAYRVYLAALVGGGAVLWLSGLVTDEPVTAAQLADVTEHGPAVLGLVFAAAVALGLRSGSDGGPVSIEAPDVTYLLLAPVRRRDVLARPVVQRLRSMAFGGALVGAVAGNLAARRLPGSPEAWTASGAAAGAVVRRGVRRHGRARPHRPAAAVGGDGAGRAGPRRPGRGRRRLVDRPGRLRRQPRHVGDAPAPARPRRRRRRRRRCRATPWRSPVACASSRWCAVPTSCRSCASR